MRETRDGGDKKKMYVMELHVQKGIKKVRKRGRKENLD